MAKHKDEQSHRWSGTWLNWSPETEKQIAVIGMYMEALSQKDELLPMIHAKTHEGEWSITVIMESVLLRTARDLHKIKPARWEEWSKFYFDTRVSKLDRYWHVSEQANNALTQIAEHVEKSGFDPKKLYHAGKLNKKLLLSMSLSYAVYWISQR